MEHVINIIGIGEVLWDIFPQGKQLGGAPCNFVYHANKLGANALVVSAVGNDENGQEILALLNKKNISEELIQVNEHPTGTVEVKLNDQGVPEYVIHENVAWDYIRFDSAIEQSLSATDIICFGSLAQRNNVSGETIASILNSAGPNTLIVFDINLRQQYYTREIIENSLQFCHVLKLNGEELQVISVLLGLTGSSEENQVIELMERYNLQLLALTNGSKGSLLVTASEKSFLPTPKVQVRDTARF
ncbi:MAG: PfkB family carbohydrate kinase [Salinivirgaceae bacterium]